MVISKQFVLLMYNRVFQYSIGQYYILLSVYNIKNLERYLVFLGTVDPHLPYTVKLSSGKTFTVVCKIHYSLENFRGA